MKLPSLLHLASPLALATLAVTYAAGSDAALIDDFTDPKLTSRGAPRMVITDEGVGGQSQATPSFLDGVLAVEGAFVPARGMPAFISVPLMLAADAEPQDVSAFEGVRLRVKVKRGMLTVQVSSSEIDNYDYHTSLPIAHSGDKFQEVRVPFKDLKRGWSEQTPLNLATITGVNLVSVGMSKDSFAYEIDEISFY